jgi:hypothetical protein
MDHLMCSSTSSAELVLKVVSHCPEGLLVAWILSSRKEALRDSNRSKKLVHADQLV